MGVKLNTLKRFSFPMALYFVLFCNRLLVKQLIFGSLIRLTYTSDRNCFVVVLYFEISTIPTRKFKYLLSVVIYLYGGMKDTGNPLPRPFTSKFLPKDC